MLFSNAEKVFKSLKTLFIRTEKCLILIVLCRLGVHLGIVIPIHLFNRYRITIEIKYCVSKKITP
ncbi:hypothetical protein L1276_005123 [Flavobacterium sp. HSC-32F16]|nr:hypothetical protein [Flavobacterium sp. HSC-32F16]